MAGFMGFDIILQKATIFGYGNDAWSTTTLSSIGLAVVNALKIPEQTANGYMYINSFNVSQNQVLASFQEVTGKKWTIETVGCRGAEKDRPGEDVQWKP